MLYRIEGDGWEVSSETPGAIMGQAAKIAETDGYCPVEVHLDHGGGYIAIVDEKGMVMERRPLNHGNV